MVRKDQVLESNNVQYVFAERDICNLGDKNPFLLKLFGSFQDQVIMVFSQTFSVGSTFLIHIDSRQIGFSIFFDGVFEWWQFNVSPEAVKNVQRGIDRISGR